MSNRNVFELRLTRADLLGFLAPMPLWMVWLAFTDYSFFSWPSACWIGAMLWSHIFHLESIGERIKNKREVLQSP